MSLYSTMSQAPSVVSVQRCQVIQIWFMQICPTIMDANLVKLFMEKTTFGNVISIIPYSNSLFQDHHGFTIWINVIFK